MLKNACLQKWFSRREHIQAGRQRAYWSLALQTTHAAKFDILINDGHCWAKNDAHIFGICWRGNIREFTALSDLPWQLRHSTSSLQQIFLVLCYTEFVILHQKFYFAEIKSRNTNFNAWVSYIFNNAKIVQQTLLRSL